MATVLVVGLCGFAPALAFASVESTDILFGKSVEERGVAFEECPSIDASYAQVVDSEGVVYFERGAITPAQIASITKVMTALVTFDAINKGIVTLDSPVVVSEAAASVGEQSASLEAGDVLTIGEIMYGVMVVSGNDAATALQETVGAALLEQGQSRAASSRDAFVERMNELAQEIGCADSVFTNPHGLDMEEYASNQHSTAADVALIVSNAMKYDSFREYVSSREAVMTLTRNGEQIEIEVKSGAVFIDNYEHAIGVKTGFTELAGPSFAAAANNGTKELYAVVLHSSSKEQRFVDAQTLCEWTYDHIGSYNLINTIRRATYENKEVPVVAEVPLSDWVDKRVGATPANADLVFELFTLEGDISQEFAIEPIAGKVTAGDKVGSVTFKQGERVLCTEDLLAVETIEAPTLMESIGVWFNRRYCWLADLPEVADAVILNRVASIDVPLTSALNTTSLISDN